MKAILLTSIIGLLLLTGSILFPAKVSAASCNRQNSTNPNCWDLTVGSSVGTSVCIPATYGDVPDVNGLVSCSLIPIGQVNSSQLTQWIAANSSNGSNSSSSGSSSSTNSSGVCVPTDCPTTYIPDFACVNNKILDPTTKCCENKCPNDNGQTDTLLKKYDTFGVLGTNVRIDQASIPSLINIVITTFLGIIALYALFRGIYVAGVKRTQATDEESLVKINKELTNIVLGFIVAFGFIFVIQIVFNILGLGSLTAINVNFTGGDTTAPAQIVINSTNSSAQ